MTQNENEIPNLVRAADVTADLLRTSDLNTLVVGTASGVLLGGGYSPASLAFGLGSYEGDYEGFAEYLRSL